MAVPAVSSSTTTALGVDDDAVAVVVPRCAIEYLCEWFVEGNAALAVYSNVCRSWRRAVVNAITAVLEREGGSGRLEMLLLPCMGREILRRRRCGEPTRAGTGVSNRHRARLGGVGNDVETYCLAWFAPMGIKVTGVTVGGDADECQSDLSEDSSSSSASLYPSRDVGCVKRKQSCGSSWSGYGNAMDVLIPFGYANEFVNTIIDIAVSMSTLKNQQNSSTASPSPVNDSLSPSSAENASCIDFKFRNDKTTKTTPAAQHSTFAVRGTLEARPENTHRRKRKQELLYPRLVLSNTYKSPVRERDQQRQRRQRALQFLNATGRRAVTLKSPYFECGPQSQPVTVFCVGIATEDGCFFSGLRRRFEMGHLYPTDPRDVLIDMSPLCIATDCVRDGGGGQARGCCDIDDSDDDDDDFSASSSEGDSDDYPPNICRGRTGPGLWHCYTALFDGSNSLLRVDGLEEQLPNQNCGNGMLDGITMGSDHCFKMSLCLGGGDTDEGEGSISELILFKGRLSEQDVAKMEAHLMTKHGITPATIATNDRYRQETNTTRYLASTWQEDEWKRQVHALIMQPAPYKIQGPGVPLRVAARHRSVAWHRVNTVTGKVVKVSRIGCSIGNGSSDW